MSYTKEQRDAKLEPVEEIKQEHVEVKKDVLDSLLQKVESLEKKDLENQSKLKMLYDVADRGRVFNYENKNVGKKIMKVKLSLYEDKIIVGWRNAQDELIKNPTTGMIVGEIQKMEILLLDKNNVTTKQVINGYSAFSDVRYNNRIEVEVVGREEKWDGTITFHLQLSDGRKISVDGAFIN